MLANASTPAALTRRPPTPPKENPSKQSSEASLPSSTASHPLLDTPEESPSSSAEYFKSSSGKIRKKVGFTGWTEYFRPSGSKGFDSDDSRRRQPPSRECNPSKSILKSSAGRATLPQPLDEASRLEQSSLPAMLRSAVTHLASGSRSSRFDAYTSLIGCLSAYDDVPEAPEMVASMLELSVSMRRDLQARLDDDGGLDAQLVAQVLKLITTLMRTKGIESLFPEEFYTFILDNSLTSLADANTPKILVLHHMHLFEKQKFPNKILSLDRQEKLVSILNSITTRAKSNRILCHRLNIYQRLVVQAKSVMVNRCDKWMDHLITGLLSAIKDVRSRAIAFGMEAGLHLGDAGSVSREWIELCNRSPPEGAQLISTFSSRLLQLLESKEDSQHVPQVWIIVLLFLRGRQHQIERWEHFKGWLGIIQKCMNSEDAQTRFQAHLAWNRLIFALDLGPSVSMSMIVMLRQPIMSQLVRKSDDKITKTGKRIARSSLSTLLYYSFRPDAPHNQFDIFWDTYVVQVLPACFLASRADRDHASEILANLFHNDKPQPKLWNDKRVNISGPVIPEELPTIDPKWIRHNVSKILNVFKDLFGAPHTSSSFEVGSPDLVAWSALMSAIGDASSKEIKVSMEALNATASILNWFKWFLQQTSAGTPSILGSNGLVTKFETLLQDVIAKIGRIPFTERRISLDTENAFEAAAETPSSRGSSKSSSMNSAAGHLLHIILGFGPSPEAASYQKILNIVLQLLLRTASTRGSRLKVLLELFARVIEDGERYQAESVSMLWNTVVQAVITTLKEPRTPEGLHASPEYLGNEYRDATKILELGIRLRSNDVFQSWQQLYLQMKQNVGDEINDDANIVVVIEPLAHRISSELVKSCDDVLVDMACLLILDVRKPISCKAFERFSNQLWGVPPTSSRVQYQKLYGLTYKMFALLLKQTYASVSKIDLSRTFSSLKAAESIMDVLSVEDRPLFLTNTQSELALWFHDKDGSVKESSALYTEVRTLCGKALDLLSPTKFKENTILMDYQDLLCSLFESRHKAIVNKAVGWWNVHMSSVYLLVYPVRVKKVLSRLREIIDVKLPGLPDSGDNVTYPPLYFMELQGSEDDAEKETPRQNLDHVFRDSRKSTPVFLTPSPNPPKTSREPQSARFSSKTTPRAKLRHDDSQIQFAAIESSPLAPDAERSQALTERQKEVRERQQIDAAMFPNIRSSPSIVPQADEYRLPTLGFQVQAMPAAVHSDGDSSPRFPPDMTINDFLGSSPTPSSTRQRRELPMSDDGPPSSPPFIASRGQAEFLPRSEDTGRGPMLDRGIEDKKLLPHHDEDDDARSCMTRRQEHFANWEDPQDSIPSVIHNHHVNCDTNREADSTPHVSLTAEQLGASTRHEEQSGGSIQEIAASDAPTSCRIQPEGYTTSTVDEEPANINQSTEIRSSQESSERNLENDEVTAQLMSEIARASSQNFQERTRKRRGSMAEAPKKRIKRNRALSRAPNPQQILKQSIADCVLVESSSAANNADRLWPPIKRERSPSLPDLSSLRESENSVSFHIRPSAPEFVASGEGKAHSSRKKRDPLGRARSLPEVDHAQRRVTRTVSKLNAEVAASPVDTRPTSAPETSEPIDLRWLEGPHGSQYAYTFAPRTSVSGQQAGYHLVGATQPINSMKPLVPETGQVQEKPNGTAILERFRKMLGEIEQVTLGVEEERALVAVLFESVHKVHEAGRRRA